MFRNSIESIDVSSMCVDWLINLAEYLETAEFEQFPNNALFVASTIDRVIERMLNEVIISVFLLATLFYLTDCHTETSIVHCTHLLAFAHRFRFVASTDWSTESICTRFTNTIETEKDIRLRAELQELFGLYYLSIFDDSFVCYRKRRSKASAIVYSIVCMLSKCCVNRSIVMRVHI